MSQFDQDRCPQDQRCQKVFSKKDSFTFSAIKQTIKSTYSLLRLGVRSCNFVRKIWSN